MPAGLPFRPHLPVGREALSLKRIHHSSFVGLHLGSAGSLGKLPKFGGWGFCRTHAFHHFGFSRGDQGGQGEGAGPKSEAVKGRARHCLSTCPSCPLFRAAGGLWILTVWLHCPSALVRGPRSNTTFWYPQEECWGRRWTHSPDHLHHPRS